MSISNHTIKIIKLLIGIGIVFFALNLTLKYQLSVWLKSHQVKGVFYTYKALDINFIDGSISMKEPSVTLLDNLGANFDGKVDFKSISIYNVSYLDLLFAGHIDVQEIDLNAPNGYLHKKKALRKIETKDTIESHTMNIQLQLQHLKINNASIKVYDTHRSDSLWASVDNFSLDVSGIKVNNQTLLHSIPFTCKDYAIQSDSIFFKVGQFEHLKISKMEGNHKKTVVKKIQFKNKYSRNSFSKILKKERDHYTIWIDSLLMIETSLQNLEDDNIQFGAQRFGFYQPKIEIFRDKLIEDELSIKPMYSQLLRKSTLQISIDTAEVNHATLIYTEKTKPENNGGSIVFKDMDITINRLGNVYTKNTTLIAEALFMKTSPVLFRWNFNPHHTKDKFEFYGELGLMPMRDLNAFTEPTMNTDLSGTINAFNFEVKGNRIRSNTLLNVNYNNLQVQLIDQKTKKKRKLLSSIINLFVSKKSKNKELPYKQIEVEVEREQTKSFFNYMVVNIKAGMKKAML